jgi:DNA-binding PadR family transcriptional regulator
MSPPSSGSAALSTADFHILLALQLRGALWGYALLEALDEVSEGVTRPDIGSLYRTLGRLLSSGLLIDAGEGESLRGKKRRYYEISEVGRAALLAEGRRLERTVELLQHHQLLSERS